MDMYIVGSLCTVYGILHDNLVYVFAFLLKFSDDVLWHDTA